MGGECDNSGNILRCLLSHRTPPLPPKEGTQILWQSTVNKSIWCSLSAQDYTSIMCGKIYLAEGTSILHEMLLRTMVTLQTSRTTSMIIIILGPWKLYTGQFLTQAFPNISPISVHVAFRESASRFYPIPWPYVTPQHKHISNMLPIYYILGNSSPPLTM